MSIKIVLNGAGRIGKSILKQLLNDENFEIVAINEINPSVENIVYSINYDSTYGKLNDKFKVIEKVLYKIKNQKSKLQTTKIYQS
jgi:glyceraldehyde 3-phosphate dehydrogenase